MLWLFIKMFLALSLLGILLFLATKYFKGLSLLRQNGSTAGGIRVLTNKLIAPQRYITLVEIGDEIFALGISPQHISFLTKIDHKESLLRRLAELKTPNNSPSWLGLWKSANPRQKLAWVGEKHED
ncbi:MAG: flagellar biosynthetic protein FliO [Thermodesulfobacteriota bacterium]